MYTTRLSNIVEQERAQALVFMAAAQPGVVVYYVDHRSDIRQRRASHAMLLPWPRTWNQGVVGVQFHGPQAPHCVCRWND
ncbi:hypothetical protein LY76DRAFT_217615 [Colletotrichum caudatum]|nr:hypothetical protein LY76DRAFT_217615 [Colletotrichum caudatum]